MTFLELAISVLQDAKDPLTIGEIWAQAEKLGLDKKLGSIGETPKDTLSARIYTDIKTNGKNASFVQVSHKPARFALNGKSHPPESFAQQGKGQITKNTPKSATKSELVLRIAKELLESAKAPLQLSHLYKLASEQNLLQKHHLKLDGDTPHLSFYAAISNDLKRDMSIFEKVGDNPTIIKLKSQKNAKITESRAEKSTFSERELHPIFAHFIYNNKNFNAYSKTIYHEESEKSKKGQNKWIHPDMVAVSFKFDELCVPLREFSNKFSQLPLKIYSFELKKRLDFSTLREFYFQAVSNSSWANFGYLVAAEIDNDPDLLELIRRLNMSFGIGVIALNIRYPEQSEIIAQAKEKEVLDFSVMNDLGQKNKNFSDFLEAICEYEQIKKYIAHEFDEILTETKLSEYQHKIGIKV